MVKTVTFDCSLGLDEFEADLKQAEADIKNARKRLQRESRNYNYYKGKRDSANKAGDTASAEKYAQAMAKAEEAGARAQYDLSQAQENYDIASQQIQENTKRMSLFGKATKSAGSFMEMIKKKIGHLAKRILIFSLLMKLLREIRSYFSGVLENNDEFVKSVGRLKGALQTLVSPLVELITPVLITIVNWLTKIITAVAQLIGIITGKGLKGMKDFAKSAQKGASQFASFDTINQLGSDSSGIEAQFDFAELTNEELNKTLLMIGAIATAILVWKNKLNIINGIKDVITHFGGLKGILETVKAIGSTVFSGIGKGISFIVEQLSKVGVFIAQHANVFGGLVLIAGGIVLIVDGIKSLIQEGLNLKAVLEVIGGLLMVGLGIGVMTGQWIPLLVVAIASIVLAFATLGGTAEQLVQGIKDVFGGLITFIKGVFTGDLKSAGQGLTRMLKGLLNADLAIIGGVINTIIRGLNWLIDKINSISFKMPDWLGGETVGFNIGHVQEWNVPYLAQGAVIPPNREFLAVLGDQTSGTNIEAPLDTIVSAVQQALGGMDTNVNVQFNGSLAQIARIMQPQITAETRRRGASLVKVGGVTK